MEQFQSFDPRNGDKTKLCIQRADYLKTEPLPVHGDSEVAEVDRVVGLNPLASWGGGAPHLLAVAHVWHLRQSCTGYRLQAQMGDMIAEGVSAQLRD